MEQKKTYIGMFAEHHRKKWNNGAHNKKVLRSNFCPLEQSLIIMLDNALSCLSHANSFFHHCTLAAVAAGGGSSSELKRTMLDAKVISDETGT